tara:strand:- start:799 stop:909 length:111 start_codon:yes stop_codon:yes gene_type:complete
MSTLSDRIAATAKKEEEKAKAPVKKVEEPKKDEESK